MRPEAIASWLRREVTEGFKLRQRFGRQGGGSCALGGSVASEHLRQFVLEFRRHRSILVQQIHPFARVRIEVVEFRLRRLNVFVLPHAQRSQRRPTESVVGVEAFAVNGARPRGLPALERAELARAFERGRGGHAQIIQNRRRHVNQADRLAERRNWQIESRKPKIETRNSGRISSFQFRVSLISRPMEDQRHVQRALVDVIAVVGFLVVAQALTVVAKHHHQ